MQHYKNILLLTIFLWKINKVLNYIFIEILKDGGYTGLFCLAQHLIDDKVFNCVKSNTTCTGMGKSRWNDPTDPLNMNYYNGTIFSCNVPCDYNENVTKINGSDEYYYFFIQKTFSVTFASEIVKNGEIYSAYIKQLNITDPSNVTLRFDNPLFTYTNLSINKNQMDFNLQVNDDKVYNTKFISKFTLIVGNYDCRKYISLGYVILHKDDFDFESYINKLKGEYEGEIEKLRNACLKYQKVVDELDSTLHHLENIYYVLCVLLPITMIILLLIFMFILFKMYLIPCKNRQEVSLTEENNPYQGIVWINPDTSVTECWLNENDEIKLKILPPEKYMENNLPAENDKSKKTQGRESSNKSHETKLQYLLRTWFKREGRRTSGYSQENDKTEDKQ